MAIAGTTNKEPVEHKKPIILPERYKHSLIQSRYNDSRNLLLNVTGTPMVGDWYRQYLGHDEEPITFQPDMYDTYQSYTHVKNVVIKAEGDGSLNFDPTTFEVGDTYMAYVMFDLVPLIGDVFLQDIGDGNLGLYIVNNQPEIRSIARDKVYFCELKLWGRVNQEIADRLAARTVETYVFSADSVLNGGNAVLTEETFEDAKRVTQCIHTLSQYILSNYVWSEERTIALKDDKYGWVYDRAFVKFCKYVIPSQMTRGNQQFYLMDQQVARTYGYDKTLSIWDVLIKGDFSMMQFVEREMNYYPRNAYYGNKQAPGFVTTRFDHILVPGKVTFIQPGNLGPHFTPNYTNLEVERTPIPAEYVWSEGFYKGEPKAGFELTVYDALKRRKIDRKELLSYYDNFMSWDAKERLYYGVVLIMLLTISRKVSLD